MISKTKISKRIKKKTSLELVETVKLAKKNNIEVAKILSGPTKARIRKNLDEIDKEKEDVIVPGKVLGNGEIKTKKKVIALSFSDSALEKLKKAGCEAILLKNALKKGKLNVKILK